MGGCAVVPQVSIYLYQHELKDEISFINMTILMFYTDNIEYISSQIKDYRI